jgi:hypothetical protein
VGGFRARAAESEARRKSRLIDAPNSGGVTTGNVRFAGEFNPARPYVDAASHPWDSLVVRLALRFHNGRILRRIELAIVPTGGRR